MFQEILFETFFKHQEILENSTAEYCSFLVTWLSLTFSKTRVFTFLSQLKAVNIKIFKNSYQLFPAIKSGCCSENYRPMLMINTQITEAFVPFSD